MARLFDQFQAPRLQRRPIDVDQLAGFLSAPEVAKQQARASLFQELGQLPQNLFNTYSQFEELKRNREHAGLEGEKTRADIEFTKARAKALGGQGGMVPVVDPVTGEIRFMVPKGAKIAPTEKPVSAESARAQTSADSGVKSAKRALEILENDPNAARKILLPMGLGFGAKAFDKQLQEFDREIENLGDAIIRARTGAAATKEEMNKFKSILLGDIARDPSVAKSSIDAIMQELGSISQKMEIGRPQMETPKPTVKPGKSQPLKTKSGIPYSME